jgi:PAT family beta-lactamase induction signal transducer AmpG
MACAAVLLGFSSATQDIVIDAYRIECADKDLQAMLSATYIAGYRIAMIVASAGCLTLADFFGTSTELYNYQAWRMAYYSIACTMLVGMATTLIASEPKRADSRSVIEYTAIQYGRFFLLFVCSIFIFVFAFFHLGTSAGVMKLVIQESLPLLAGVAGFLVETVRLAASLGAGLIAARSLVWAGLVDSRMLDDTYIDPVTDFFSRYGLKSALLLLFLVGFYRISDIVLGVISMVFYVDLGFSKTEIAAIVQTFGILMTIVGGFLGGMLTVRYSVKKILMAGAVLASATNILFMILANVEPNIWLLKMVIAADNLAAGMASAAFVAFLSGLTSISFTAMQYAIFSSLMTLFPKLLAGYSGSVVDSIGYSSFFLLTALIGVPVMALIWLVRKVD